ncbi:MAG TPA: ABC transporter ATP-binding protein, partial [Terriglobales bacterium]|nr:ABC transporter ATP-binding protein [Terriglobales bacterium]
IEHILTDLIFMDRGRIVLQCTMDEYESRYAELQVKPENLAAAQALRPMQERQILGRTTLIFDGVDRTRLSQLGDVRTPGIADLFVAIVGNGHSAKGATS